MLSWIPKRSWEMPMFWRVRAECPESLGRGEEERALHGGIGVGAGLSSWD